MNDKLIYTPNYNQLKSNFCRLKWVIETFLKCYPVLSNQELLRLQKF